MVDAEAVWRRLATAGGLDGLGIAHHNGRWDLRGIGAPPLPWSQKDPNPTLRGVTLTGLDASDANLHHFRFFNVVFVDCIFKGADLFDWRLWDSKVEDCSFEQSNLRSAGLGGDLRSPNTWISVDFEKADLQSTSHMAELYTDCSFSDARLKRVDFDGSRHVRSTFAGLLDEVQFRSLPKGRRKGGRVNTMDGVNFDHATVRFPTFEKLDLSSCVLPSSSEHLKFDQRRTFAEKVLQRVRSSGVDQPYLRSLMEGHMRDAVDGAGGPGFQHRLDLGETPEEISAAEALMRECGAYDRKNA